MCAMGDAGIFLLAICGSVSMVLIALAICIRLTRDI